MVLSLKTGTHYSTILSMRRILTSVIMLAVLMTTNLHAEPDTPYAFDTCIAYDYILTDDQRLIVDLLYENLISHEYTIAFEEEVPVSDLDAAVTHILSDYPELFYIAKSYHYYFYDDDEWISEIEFTPSMSKDEADYYTVQLLALTNEVADAIPDSLSDYSRELALHDILADYVTYSDDNELDYTPLGALLYGRAACEGYAEAFALLLRSAGIPCSTISGTGYTRDGSESHEWNIVEIDGNHTLVDVTWNDRDDAVSHLYFNVTDELMSRDHKPSPEYRNMPEADSMKFNYHKINGIIFSSSSDIEDIVWTMFDYCFGTGEGIEVRFSDMKAYSLFLSGFDDAAQNYANEYGDISYCTSQDDMQYSFFLSTSTEN